MSLVIATNLKTSLERIGLSQYYESFVAEAFDTWDVVMDITEADLYVIDNEWCILFNRNQRSLKRQTGSSQGE